MNSLYNIKCSDTFNRYEYPLVEEELTLIRRGTGHLHAMSKGEIIISYYKDHCLKVQWLKDHPELIRMITSRHFAATNLESLFDSSRGNKGFLDNFQDHIKISFSEQIVSNT
jgi:hypothetical protein